VTGRCRRWRCPSCGLFGRKARRRAADAEAAAHVAWAAGLAEAKREADYMATPCPGCQDPGWAGYWCETCDPLADMPRLPRPTREEITPCL
jgi:hypothetical protein